MPRSSDSTQPCNQGNQQRLKIEKYLLLVEPTLGLRGLTGVQIHPMSADSPPPTFGSPPAVRSRHLPRSASVKGGENGGRSDLFYLGTASRPPFIPFAQVSR